MTAGNKHEKFGEVETCGFRDKLVDRQQRYSRDIHNEAKKEPIFFCAYLLLCFCTFVRICLQCFDAVGWAAGKASGL